MISLTVLIAGREYLSLQVEEACQSCLRPASKGKGLALGMHRR
jgi:hypothetical protein